MADYVANNHLLALDDYGPNNHMLVWADYDPNNPCFRRRNKNFPPAFSRKKSPCGSARASDMLSLGRKKAPAGAPGPRTCSWKEKNAPAGAPGPRTYFCGGKKNLRARTGLGHAFGGGRKAPAGATGPRTCFLGRGKSPCGSARASDVLLGEEAQQKFKKIKFSECRCLYQKMFPCLVAYFLAYLEPPNSHILIKKKNKKKKNLINLIN